MSYALPVPFSCSNSGSPCVTVQVPGPQGPPGKDGIDGLNGLNAFTTAAATFVMPAVGAAVIALVVDTSWMVPTVNYGGPGQVDGQYLKVQYAGTMLVGGVIDDTHVQLINVGDPNTATAGTVIPIGARIGVGGARGAAGAAGSSSVKIMVGPPSVMTPGDFDGQWWIDRTTANIYYWDANLMDWVPVVTGP